MLEAPIHIPGSAVLVVDYGGQYAHLIARRLRELGVPAVVTPYTRVGGVDLSKYSAVVLSGSQRSVLEADPAVLDSARRVLGDAETPVLGVCFGHQLIARILGGVVEKGCGEYGRVMVRLVERDELFNGWGGEEYVWMSHGDCVSKPPPGSRVLAVSENGIVAALKIVLGGRVVYTVQFHPEVSHTVKGLKLLDNFARFAGVERKWVRDYYYSLTVVELEKYKGVEGPVVAAVSGGVDSTVAAALARRVLGDRVVPVLVDHGLFREGEVEEVVENLAKAGLKPLVLDEKERFLSRLEGVADCEERRRIIGEEFAKVFDQVMEEQGARVFIQGTTYPDIVESGGTGVADRIKSHHNVAGLPLWFREKYLVAEPLKHLYKDEVREVARMLGVPEYFVKRQPFPGPGLAVRVVGVFTRRKLEICRRASAVVEQVLRRHGLLDKVWQAFAVVGDDKWVGVKGDARRVGYVVIVRIVESSDAMTADYFKLPYSILDEVSREITRSIEDVTMVAYAVTTKPPSTIEPC
ncbi:glutamine-hydrolyzing GMP synthase [Thermosphaera chiliense]|uniref:GMP synthase (glutamine-hydrolyzing) n=1 Tax=Thermosphaera chiliense TaxID=3402707 RepID=A0A7M1USX5_9CREN|nr:glutamine-hydrolyzing GMP synthase [Thermosphaera aggregans]QOR94677.1 glutamine-hydrolyzing GMP synthase [Thermosphaera aggregans]